MFIAKYTYSAQLYPDPMVVLLKIEIFFEAERIIKEGGISVIVITGVMFWNIHFEDLDLLSLLLLLW